MMVLVEGQNVSVAEMTSYGFDRGKPNIEMVLPVKEQRLQRHFF
jgi:hypothetical protein